MILAKGLFVIHNINDVSEALSVRIVSNHGKHQFFNPQSMTFKPDYSTDKLILTPSIYRNTDFTNNIIENEKTKVTNIQWHVSQDGKWKLIKEDEVYLTVTDNMFDEEQRLYQFSCKVLLSNGDYQNITSHYQLKKEINDENLYYLVMTTPLGNTFSINNVNKYITIEAKVISGGQTVRNLDVSRFIWCKRDKKNVRQIFTKGLPEGWYPIKNQYVWDNENNVCRLTISVEDVKQMVDFMCVYHDEGTNGYYYGRTTIHNQVRLSNVFIQTSNGAILRNRNEETCLTARVIDRNQEVDYQFPYQCIYEWRIKENGKLVNDWYKTGKSIIVGGVDVNSTSDFICDVTSIDLLNKQDNIIIERAKSEYFRVDINKDGRTIITPITLPSSYVVEPFLISDVAGNVWKLIIDERGELNTEASNSIIEEDIFIKSIDSNDLFKILSVGYGKIKIVNMNINLVTEVYMNANGGYAYKLDIDSEGTVITERINDHLGVDKFMTNNWNVEMDDEGHLLATKVNNFEERDNVYINFLSTKKPFDTFSLRINDDGILETDIHVVTTGVKDIGLRAKNGYRYRIKINREGILLLERTDDCDVFYDTLIMKDRFGMKHQIFVSEDEIICTQEVETTIKEETITLRCFEASSNFALSIDEHGFLIAERIN